MGQFSRNAKEIHSETAQWFKHDRGMLLIERSSLSHANQHKTSFFSFIIGCSSLIKTVFFYGSNKSVVMKFCWVEGKTF